MDKAVVINEIDIILNKYCDGCFLKKQLAADYGKAAAHRFCISTCTIGDHLKFLGKEMNKMKK